MAKASQGQCPHFSDRNFDGVIESSWIFVFNSYLDGTEELL
jgi:hypothetical protein